MAMTATQSPPKGSILTVEDDPDISDMLRLYFSAIGYQVHVAQRGRDGVEAATREVPDLVLLDIMLPDIDGYQVCSELRASNRTRDIPVIFLSQKDNQEDKVAGLGLGAVDYVTKPFDIEELKLRAERVIRRNRQRGSTNPRTGLPGRQALEDQIHARNGTADWALLNCQLEHYEPFVDKYGFVAGDQVLRHVAQLMQSALTQMGSPEDFVAHTDDSEFTLLIHDDRRLQKISKEIYNQFQKTVSAHYSFWDREQGYIVTHTSDGAEVKVPLMKIAIRAMRPKSR